MHEYLFDVKLFASVRVKAATEEEAVARLRADLDGASANLGVWAAGPEINEPILAEVSLDDEDPDLVEVDGVFEPGC